MQLLIMLIIVASSPHFDVFLYSANILSLGKTDLEMERVISKMQGAFVENKLK